MRQILFCETEFLVEKPIKRRGNFPVIDSANNGKNCHRRFSFSLLLPQNHSYYVNTNRWMMMPLLWPATLNCCTTTQLLQKRRERFAVVSMISQQQRHSIAASRKSVGYKKLAFSSCQFHIFFAPDTYRAMQIFPAKYFFARLSPQSNLFIRAYFYACLVQSILWLNSSRKNPLKSLVFFYDFSLQLKSVLITNDAGLF